MKIIAYAALFVLSTVHGTSVAQGVLFSDGFGEAIIEPLFSVSGGAYIIAGDDPAPDALRWFLDELQSGESTTEAEVTARFDASWFSGLTAQQTADFVNAVRADYPDALITDLVSLTPMGFTGIIAGSSGNEAFVTLQTRFVGGGINQLGVQFFGTGGGSVIYAADQNLTFAEAADKFATLASSPALFVGRISENGECVSVEERNSASLAATASVFKIWVLGGVADAIALGDVEISQDIPRIDAKRAPGGPLISEPDGTLLTVDQLARLMMGNSDNTATDLLHDLVGRDRINSIVSRFGHANPAILTPLLNISEQFHLFFSFSFTDANNYATGSESFQNMFLANQIEPLGSFADTGGGFSNESLFVDGSWRATPIDVCRALAAQRRWPAGSDAMRQVDRALGAQVAQPRVRPRWDRVWYKGGSLESGVNGLLVLTHAWLLENAGDDPYVVVAMLNNGAGGIDTLNTQSILGRILELLP